MTVKNGNANFHRAFEDLTRILRDQQRSAGMGQERAASAAGRSQSWWSKVINRQIVPDHEPLLRFLQATGADDDIRRTVQGLYDQVAVEATSRPRTHVQKIGNRRWLGAMDAIDDAGRLTIVSTAYIPVELRTPDLKAHCGAEADDRWRRRALAVRARDEPILRTKAYRFLLSEAAVLSAHALPLDGAADQFHHLWKMATSPNVEVAIVPLTDPAAASLRPLVLTANGTLIAEAPSGAIVDADGPLYEAAVQTVDAGWAAALTAVRLRHWLDRRATARTSPVAPRVR